MPAFVCSSWTNKLITAKDHASVQINIGHLNEHGQYDNNFTTFALAGNVRSMVRGSCCSGVVFNILVNEFLHFRHGNASEPCTFKSSCLLVRDCKSDSTLMCLVQGSGDSAVDTLWKKKAETIGQQ